MTDHPMIDFAIRRLHSTDSLDDLIRLLHRAFRDLALQGVDCQCEQVAGAQALSPARPAPAPVLR